MNVEIKPGWCCRWLTCPSPVGCECVSVRGVELCLACAATEVGLPADTTEGNLDAALLREPEAVAA